MRALGIAILCTFSVLFAAPGYLKNGELDQEFVRAHYMDGEFDIVLSVLEPYIKIKGETMTRDEKVFCFKHLAVIYASNPQGKTKAESYMFQMLRLVPSIELVDMYVSDNVEMLFKSVKREFLEKQAYKQQFDQYGNPISKPKNILSANSNSKEKPKPSKTWLWWTGGGIVVAGAVATYVFWPEEKTTTKSTAGE